MKVTRHLFLALLLPLAFATQALALPPNKVLNVQLLMLNAAGQLSPPRTTSVTSDGNGKVSFNLTSVPTSDSAPFLVLRIFDGSTMLRQSVFASPAPGGAINAGVSEVTTSQATAMIKAFADSGGGDSILAAMVLTMVRSGAIASADLLNISPLARGAASAFETYLTNNGAGAQLPALRANLVPALRDLAAGFKESVDSATIANEASTGNPALDAANKTASNQLEARKRGDAVAQFLAALVNAGADAGISPALMQTAFSEAGKAVEALTSPVSSDVVASILAIFRTGAQHCQLRAEMRNFSHALPFMNVTTGTRQPLFVNATSATRKPVLDAALQQFNSSMLKYNSAAVALDSALFASQETFELIFADPASFPALPDIITNRDIFVQTLQSATNNMIATTTASPAEITAMQSNMAAGMAQLGGVMTNMTSLQQRGVGSIFTTPTASSQNWLEMMVAGANYVTPALQMTYSSSVNTLFPTLSASFPTLTPPPTYTMFVDPYKSLLRLQYDLMLLKFNNQLALSLAGPTPSLAALAQAKENDLSLRRTLLQGIKVKVSGTLNNSDLANAFMIVMAQPELL